MGLEYVWADLYRYGVGSYTEWNTRLLDTCEEYSFRHNVVHFVEPWNPGCTKGGGFESGLSDKLLAGFAVGSAGEDPGSHDSVDVAACDMGGQTFCEGYSFVGSGIACAGWLADVDLCSWGYPWNYEQSAFWFGGCWPREDVLLSAASFSNSWC